MALKAQEHSTRWTGALTSAIIRDMDDLQDRVIGGRFRVVQLIGKGGMGSVYEARHLSLPRTYAIKILLADLATDEGFIERFRREAIAMSKIDHPNVIRITDYGETGDGSVYLVMEFLEGDGLDDVLNRRGKLPVERALTILAQISDALEVAHQEGVIHRDLKPENILLTSRHGRKDFVKLLDFGIAKVRTPEFDGTPLTIQGEVFGTAEYMSPEQATGKPQDGRSDIYALGCLLYELISGEPPFLGSAVEVLRSHVFTEPPPPSSRMQGGRIMPELDTLVMRCLAKEPADRYQTCAELRQDLVRVRAATYSISEEMAQKSRVTGRMALLSSRQMSTGWQALGGKAPQILIPFSETSVLLDDPEQAETLMVSPKAPPALGHSEERAARRGLLRQVATSLMRSALAPDDAGESLERLLAVEEDLTGVEASIQALEQSLHRHHFDQAMQERPLRRANGFLARDLATAVSSRERGEGDQAALDNQIRDLEFQIGQLDNRCSEVQAEWDSQLEELNQELASLRKERSRLREESSDLWGLLRAQIRGLSTTHMPVELQDLFAQLN